MTDFRHPKCKASFFRGNKRVGEKRYEYADETSYHTRVGYACEVVFQSRFLFCLFQASHRSSSGSDGSLQLRIADCEGGPFQRLLFLLAMASFQEKRAVVYSLSQGVRREGGASPIFGSTKPSVFCRVSSRSPSKGRILRLGSY